MKKLDRSKVVYNFSADNEPIIKVDSGKELMVETDDCFRSQLQTEEDSLAEMNWNQINPATGPIYINDASPGDILKIEIKDIEVDTQGVMIAAPDEGVIGDRVEQSTTKVLPVKDNHVMFNDIKLPLQPMIGVIGTAPAEGEIPNGTPDSHGGNMDCKRITAGSTLYLPVAVEGALLAMGDLHAVMGDGEIVVCGAEARGKVNLKVDVLKGSQLPLPMLEDDKRVITIASAETLDQAADDATDNMVDFLMEYFDYSLVEAGMLLSLIGDLRVCQVVDPLKTARFELNKEYINNSDIMEVIR